VLLRREKEENASSSSSAQRQRRSLATFSIYRHTIPTFIPMDKLAHRYLPQPRPIRKRGGADDEIEALKSKARTRKQDLSAFVRQLRKEIAAWHVRRDSISWLQERVGVPSTTHDGDEAISEQEETRRQRKDFAALLVSLAATSLECRYVRLEWRDGRVGRFKISNSGLVERAVVIGDKGRDKRTEAVLMGGDRRIETLVDRLLGT
jgi:central kinetochore subunit Mal2/MCM21